MTSCAPFYFVAWRWVPQGCANKNVPFFRLYTTYPFVLPGIFSRIFRIIFTVNRIILPENCYGAPWGNAAVLCGLLDGGR